MPAVILAAKALAVLSMLGGVPGAANAASTPGDDLRSVTSGRESAQPGGVTYPRAVSSSSASTASTASTASPASPASPLSRDVKAPARESAAVPLATDFAAHAQRAKSLDVPLIVLVSLRDCVYCGPIRQRELAPLVRSGKYEVREIGMDSTAAVRDFDGSTTTGVAWARAHGAKVSPTVLFLDTNGRPVAEPLIGAGLPDFYGAYLDDAIARGRARLHGGNGNSGAATRRD
ncbi:hypothetical protein FP568_01795 [Pandoraea pnomenusa]|uniref:hypothetical protein n=1 Tax=Pandoraea pnomenusa TaxID=93220 RepID=UPI001198C51B|nr:hypothetical protein [Pandoraea pnomenusa]QDX20106.1 hypothetical protein FP568_01795 [Pandoraea pnomenusa]